MSKTDLQTLQQSRDSGKTFTSLIQQMKPQLAMALPKHLNADRMLRIVTTEYRKNQKIGECSPLSVIGATVALAQLGLEPGIMGQAYLVPYKGECQGIPGWQGIVDLISRTGRASVWTGAVYDGDFFEYELGDRPFLKHRPNDEGRQENLLYTYAIGRVNKAEWPVIEVWSLPRLQAHFKRNNKVGDRHYAHNNWEMYARKVPLLQVAKYMPKSVELQTALDLEGAAETGVTLDLDAALHGDVPSYGEQQAHAAAQNEGEPPPEKEAKRRATQKDSANERAAQRDKEPAKESQREPEKQPEKQPAGFSVDEIMQMIADAKTVAQLSQVDDIIRSVEDETQKDLLGQMAKNKRGRLSKDVGLSME